MSSIETIGNNTDKMVTLISKDGISYSVDINTVIHSLTIKNILDDLGYEGDVPIPIPTVNGDVLKKVLIFCDYIQHNPEDTQHLEQWTEDRTFIISLRQWFSDFISVDQKNLFEIILAANFLDIQLLLNLGTKYVASLIRNNTPDELKTLFAENTASDAGPA
jgi:S-phase kinase-associated protein 1